MALTIQLISMRIIIFMLISLFATTYTYSQSYEDFVNQAMDYLDKENYESAEQSLLSALKLEPANPSNTLLLVNLGTVQRKLKKYDEALINYDAAIAKYPNVPVLLHSRAALYCEMDSLKDALKDYNTILLYNSDDEEALFQRALLYTEAKKYDDALADLKRITQIDTDNLRAKKNIALILKLQKKWDEAEDIYTNLIYDNRTNGELYLNRAECYLNLRKLAKTQRDLTKAQEYAYTNDMFYILRGQLKLEHYNKREAKEDFLKAQELGANKEVIAQYLHLCK